MATTDTTTNQVIINRLTKTQFDNASSISNTELYAVDMQFSGGKLLKTDSNGEIVESTATEADALAGATALQPNDNISELTNDAGYTTNVGTVTSVNNVSPVNGNVSLTIPSMNSSNNYVPYRSGTSAFSNSTLMYNSSAMAFTSKLHIGSTSPANYADKGRLTIYDNQSNTQVSSLALLNYGGGGGCGVAIDMYNTSANGGIPSGRIGVVDNGNYSGYLQLQVKKSGAQSNPLLPAMNVVPIPAPNSTTTCVSFGQDEFNRVLFDLHRTEAYITITDADKRWSGSGTTYYVSGTEKFTQRLMVAVGDIVYFNAGTEATVTSVTSSSTQLQITTDVTLGSISSKSLYIKKAYMRISDENGNTKLIINPYGKMGIGTVSPSYDLDVVGNINASTDVKVNGSSVALASQIPTVNNPTITITQGGVTKGTFTLNQSSASTIALDAGGGSSQKTFNILDWKWSDYELNDQNWLRADTFSWQDGTVYSDAYDHLVDDYSGGTSQTETVGSYTITYTLATDGHKITTDETTVANIYAESGVAWYYVLDTTNTRFKLPRSLHGNIVEKYQNGSSWYRVYSDGWCEQGARYATSTNIESISFFKQFANVPTVFASVESTTRTSYVQSCIDIYNLTTSGFTKQYLMNITDGWAWMACGYLSSVPSNGQYKNLYFYVGEFTQTATEQTAGLNSELFNSKLDLDLGNITNGAKEEITSFGIPDYSSYQAYTANDTFYADKDYYFRCNVVNGNYSGNVYSDSALQTSIYFWQFYITATANACQIPVCIIPKGTYYKSNASGSLYTFKGES